jgi:hypothetical protein
MLNSLEDRPRKDRMPAYRLDIFIHSEKKKAMHRGMLRKKLREKLR